MTPAGLVVVGLRDAVTRDRVREINVQLLQFAQKGAEWTSIQINRNSVASPHEDKGNAGLSMIVLVSSFSGGLSYSGLSLPSSPGGAAKP